MTNFKRIFPYNFFCRFVSKWGSGRVPVIKWQQRWLPFVELWEQKKSLFLVSRLREQSYFCYLESHCQLRRQRWNKHTKLPSQKLELDSEAVLMAQLQRPNNTSNSYLIDVYLLPVSTKHPPFLSHKKATCDFFLCLKQNFLGQVAFTTRWGRATPRVDTSVRRP